MTRLWLELDDDNRIILVTDRGEGHDLETAVVRDDYQCPAWLRDEWHDLNALRQDARAFGAACEAEAAGTWESTRGRLTE